MDSWVADRQCAEDIDRLEDEVSNWTLHTTHVTIYTAHWLYKLNTEHGTLHTAHCTLHTTHWKLYTAQCIPNTKLLHEHNCTLKTLTQRNATNPLYRHSSSTFFKSQTGLLPLFHHILLKCIYFSAIIPLSTSIYLQSWSKNANNPNIYPDNAKIYTSAACDAHDI